jgi:hypothetical protein
LDKQPTMIDPTWAQQFAEEWIAAWNSHDLERILAHYTDDFEIPSPLIVERMNEPSGTLKGKTCLALTKNIPNILFSQPQDYLHHYLSAAITIASK